MMDVYRCPQFTRPVVYTAKFKHVTNAAALRARIVAAGRRGAGDAERAAVDFAFINARLITSPLHLQTAAVQALLADAADARRTKTVHAEIIWYLDPSNNISEAFKRYGVSDDTTDLIVMHMATWERTDVLDNMRAVVDGELDPVANMGQITDWPTVIQHYKLDQEGFTGRDEEEKKRVDNIVVSAVAMKSIL